MLNLRSQESNHISLIDGKVKYPVEKNPYESILVDITNRCNMNCNFCYNPARTLPDMSVEYFEHVCASLPFPVAIKLAGGEPTLHPNLVDFMRIALKYRHTVYICSNGIKYSDPAFMDSLSEFKKTGSSFCLGLSMDGGYANKRAYEFINGKNCLKQKLSAFDSLISYKLGRVCLTAIIIRGLNEDVIPQLIALANTHNETVRYIHFRNVGKVGICKNAEPYSINELKELISRYFSEDEFRPMCTGELHCTPESGNVCCYRFRPTNRLQVSIIEFASERSAKCPKRGRLINGTNAILPLFESMK